MASQSQSRSGVQSAPKSSYFPSSHVRSVKSSKSASKSSRSSSSRTSSSSSSSSSTSKSSSGNLIDANVLVHKIEDKKTESIYIRNEQGDQEGPFDWDRVFDDYLKNKITEDTYVKLDAEIKSKQLKDVPYLYQRLQSEKKALQKELKKEIKLKAALQRKRRLAPKGKRVSSVTSVSSVSSSSLSNLSASNWTASSAASSSWSGSTYPTFQEEKNPKYAGKNAMELIRMCTDKDTALLDALEKLIGVERLSQVESNMKPFVHKRKSESTTSSYTQSTSTQQSNIKSKSGSASTSYTQSTSTRPSKIKGKSESSSSSYTKSTLTQQPSIKNDIANDKPDKLLKSNGKVAL